MTVGQIAFQSTATIYKSDKFISIESLFGASALMYREDKRTITYLEHTVSDEVLGQALLAALERSRFVHPSEKAFYDPERATRVYRDWQNGFAAHHGSRSVRDAFKNVDWCQAKVIDGKIYMQPHRRHSPGSWRSLPENQTVIIPVTDNAAAVGAALRSALDRCE
ncbi:MAG: contact-dependent growth inhibition system immunity protein [Rhizomicrobium sp.]